MNAFKLTFFDLTQSFPLAAKILFQNMGLLRTVQVFILFGLKKITFRPFKALPKTKPLGRAEALTRHQLLPVLLLDAIFKTHLKIEPTQSLSILKQIVSQSGALFIQYAVQNPSPAAWHQMDTKAKNHFATRSLQQFFNAETHVVQAPQASFGFNVSLCHFVTLTTALGRSDLAPLFCAADEVLFDRPELHIIMKRDETLAQGHSQCAFRFQWDSDSKTSDAPIK